MVSVNANFSDPHSPWGVSLWSPPSDGWERELGVLGDELEGS